MRPVALVSKSAASLLAGAVLLVGLSACEVADSGTNLVAGKEAFIQKCGSCHILERAGTTGVSGPNLDAAFERALADGMRRSTIEGVVRAQIDIPAKRPQFELASAEDETLGPYMPADLVEGELAEDVAAYVAYAAARPGEDTGRLADVGVEREERSTQAEDGRLEIPAAPDGSLAYVFTSATAPPGSLTITSPNESNIPHNIALEGQGLEPVLGDVVQDGGVSEIQVDVEPGEYTYFCSVPGHREGGMEGTLTVEQ